MDHRSPPRAARRLVATLAGLSVVAFIVIGASLHLLVANQVRNRYEHLAESQAVLLINELTRDALAPLATVDLRLPAAREQLVAASEAIVGSARDHPEALQVIVWRRDGLVLASTEARLTAASFPQKTADLEEALRQGVGGEVLDLSAPKGPYERRLPSRTFRTAVLLRVGNVSSGPVAVAELYQDFAGTDAAIASAVRKEDTVVAGGLFLLWLPLLLMLYRTGRMMRGQALGLVEREDALRKVSARRDRAEVALQESEARFRAIFEGAAIGVALLDLDGRILESNPALGTMLGREARDLLGSTIAEFTHDDDVTADLALFQELVAGARDHYQLEKRYRRGDGSTFWGQLTASVVRDTTGAARFGIGMVENIETRKRAEEALRQAYAQEREAAERLRALDEVKSGILTAVSHELRTPLAAVLGYALTLHERGPDLPEDVAEEFAERLAVKAKKLDRLLSDLLDLDRLVRGVIEPRRRVTDIAALVHGVAEDVDVGDHPLRLEAEDTVASVDPPKVERIVENLVVNAAKYAPPGTPIWVRVRPEDDGVLIAVEDAGPGIPAEERNLIFEPFRRGHASPAHAPGTGVGLSLVAQFVELHGGRVWVEDRPEGGSSFRVFLPAAPAAEGRGGDGSDEDEDPRLAAPDRR